MKPDLPVAENDRNEAEAETVAFRKEDIEAQTTAAAPSEASRAPGSDLNSEFKTSPLDEETSDKDKRRALAALLEPSIPAANDDQESIGALVKALGTRTGSAPIIGATIATAFWLFCLLAIYAEEGLSNSEVVVFGLGITGVYAVLLLTIAVFARSIEVHATARSLVKIVAGLNNPDLVAANKVGTISQIVKNEMDSIDGSIDRTLARAGQLEVMLKSEYLDFERSFSENEQQFRNFLDSLSSERAAVVTNAEKVRSAIAGAHQNLSRDLDDAASRFARLITEASVGLANTIDEKSAELTKAASAASDKCAAKLDSALEGSIIRASDLVENRGDKFAALLSSKGNDLDEKLSARMKDASDLLERQIKDAQDKAAFRVDAMATQIDKLLRKMDGGIGERGEAINAMLATRTIDIARTLKDTGNEFKQTLDRTASFTEDFVKKAQSIHQQLDQQVGRLAETVVVPLETVTATIDEKGRMLSANLADRFTTIDGMLTVQSNRLGAVLDREIETLKVTLDGSIETMRSVLGSGSNELKSSVADRAQKIEAVLSERLSAFSALISENRTRLAFELSSHTQSLDHMLDRQRALLTDLADPRVGGVLSGTVPAKISMDRKSVSIEASVQPPKAKEIIPRPEHVAPRTPDYAVPRNVNAASPYRSSNVGGSQTGARQIDGVAGPVQEKTVTDTGPRGAGPQQGASQHGSVAQSRAPSLSAVTQRAPTTVYKPAAPKTLATDGASVVAGKTWLSDLLARASVEEDVSQPQNEKPNYQDAPISSIAANVGNFIKSDELQVSWERYNTGGPGDFQNIYTPKGAVMQLKIRQRLVEDGELRQAVNSYVTEFERLLQEVHQDNGDDLIFEYLHTDAGKVYTMLAHASNRLGSAS